MEQGGTDSMKVRVAHTIKWNVIDKVASQLLYAVTGIVLARVLSQDDFGLVGAVLVFQSFATLFVDSGFSSALIQKKTPSDLDYSTVLWFNIGVAALIYAIMFFAAPLVALCFENDARLIPLTRVMFLVSIINATAIVQINRLMKRMDVRMVAVSNSLGLVVGAVVGIWMALAGYGAWALVWQYIAVAVVKSGVLWFTGSWLPMLRFSWFSLKSIFNVGMGVMATSFLNVVFQNIYSFVIGNRVGLVALGYYTQSDKWSKMPVASLSAVLTSSFLPVLSQYQDNEKKFAAATAKMSRFTAYITFPVMIMLMVCAQPVFHALFGEKWDASVPLFQLLCLRGIFTILGSLYNNFIIALGRSRLMIWTEVVRDVSALVAIAITLPYIALSSPGNITEGLVIFLWGQVAASVLAWLVTLVIASNLARRGWWAYVWDCVPYLAITVLACAVMLPMAAYIANPWLLLAAQGVAGIMVYMGVNQVLGSKMQRDAIAYLTRKNLDSAFEH